MICWLGHRSLEAQFSAAAALICLLKKVTAYHANLIHEAECGSQSLPRILEETKDEEGQYPRDQGIACFNYDA